MGRVFHSSPRQKGQIGDINSVAPTGGHRKFTDSNVSNSKVHQKPPQSLSLLAAMDIEVAASKGKGKNHYHYT